MSVGKLFAAACFLLAAHHVNQEKMLKKKLTKNRRIILASMPVILYTTKSVFRRMSYKKVAKSVTTLTTDEYTHNLAELWNAASRASVTNILEINLRATQGTVINRPLGSPKRFDGYDNLMFDKSQLGKLSQKADTYIDMKVTLGTRADKPLTLDIPLLISGMGYGVAVSEPVKIALARGAKEMRTATNSGEGPYLEEERREAGKYILQISRWPWGLRTDKQIAAADMLEVQISQGAHTGTYYLSPEEIRGKARKLMGLSRNQGISSLPAPPGVEKAEHWKSLVDKLRQRANGIPIGIKMMATNKIEEDLAIAVDSGFDVIAVDGSQGGALISYPTMQDDFGIPSIHALVRAVRYLQERGVREQVTLIVAGGYYTPGSCLKALALGADAVYLGTVPLYALLNLQHKKVVPWEPPTTLVSYSSKDNKKLDVSLGAQRVSNVLRSMVVEMEQVIRALGKTSIKELNPDDLAALDSFSAELTGVRKVY